MNKKEALAQLEEHLSEAPVDLKEYTLKSWEKQAEDVDSGHWIGSVFFVWTSSKEGACFWNAIDRKDWQKAQSELSKLNPVYDYINPNHYKQSGKEVIDMMIAIWGKEAIAIHCEITAFKYRMRLGLKPDQPIERDLEKAKWYEAKAKKLKDMKIV